MSEQPKAALVLHVERVKSILEGVVQSRSDPDREYIPRILLSANLLCTCTGSQAADSKCAHLVALLQSLDADELRAYVLDAHQIPGDES